jgi:aminoglycoside phosphotransferase (APT) family kinase protein
VSYGAIPSSMAHLPDAGARMGRAVVRTLAQLHLLNPDACGLADLGRPEGFARRQVEGWVSRWQLVAPPQGAEIMSEVAETLAGSLPEPQRISVLHLDYKLDNCQFRPGEPDAVHAVFDWDMATLGDPLIDLGALLNYWPDPSDTPSDQPLIPPGLETIGLPTRAEVVELYRDQTGLELSGISWYEAFACFRTAVVMQQLYARWERGETTDARMSDRGSWVIPMAHRSARMLGLRPSEPQRRSTKGIPCVAEPDESD